MVALNKIFILDTTRLRKSMWLTLQEWLKKHSKNTAVIGAGRRPRRSLSGRDYARLWLLWVLAGTIFYAFAPGSNLGWAEGFYMAIDIGYSIGWGYPTEGAPPHTSNLWFSTIYVVLGASLVALALGFFADKVVEDSDNWFTNLLQQKEYENDVASDKPLTTRIKAWIKFHKEAVRAIGLWLFWIAIMILYSMGQIGWSFTEAQYFAVTSLSTGGHWGIPNDSPDWMFGLTGIFVALGVPIMAVAMASVATLIIDLGDVDAMKARIREDVTAEELKTLQRFQLEDGDGEIDRAEYIILCMVRMGTDPNLVQFISDNFRKLDTDGGGTLSMQEITQRQGVDEEVGEDPVLPTEQTSLIC